MKVKQIIKATPKVVPTPGKGGYMPVGSDRYPIHVTWVSLDLTNIRFRRMGFKGLGDYYSENQRYEFFDRPGAPEEEARLAKNGHYYTKGGMAHGSIIIPSGEYDAYQDPSF